MVDISIVIVSYNTKDLLRNCIQSVISETKIYTFEIIVVDNDSKDGSAAMVESSFPGIILLQNSNNAGFAAANNQGIAVAKGDFILLLNSDTVILDAAIDKTCAFMKSNDDVGIAGCRQLYPSRKLQPSCRSFPTVWNIFTEATFLYQVFPRTKIFGQYYLSYFDYQSNREIDVVMGSYMMIRRDVMNSVAGFDETFFFYTEETDLCYRARKNGFRSYYFSGAEIIHIGGGSTKNLLWMFQQLHRSQYQFIDKHYHGINNISMRFLKRFGIVIRIPVYFIQALIFFDRLTLDKAIVHIRLAVKNFRKAAI